MIALPHLNHYFFPRKLREMRIVEIMGFNYPEAETAECNVKQVKKEWVIFFNRVKFAGKKSNIFKKKKKEARSKKGLRK